jgi:hypothetical protein
MIEIILIKLIGIIFMMLSLFFLRVSFTDKSDEHKISNVRSFGAGFFLMFLSIIFLLCKVSLCELTGLFC